jgi:beta-glucosidase
VVLGPTINIHRDPRAGRNFECFSEDPLLSGELGAAIVNGIQSKGVGACPKHFVCNDAETDRHNYNVQESLHGRTLREIYLAAWQHLLRKSDPVAIMTALVSDVQRHFDEIANIFNSYNQTDNSFCSENKPLLEGILRETWGFKGIAISDWFGTQSTTNSIKAGLDLEMPFPVWRAKRLVEDVKSGKVTEEELNRRVIKMLEFRNRTRFCHADEPERSELNEETDRIARDLATDGFVLLKNENHALPIDTSQSLKIAVIGEFAQQPVLTGGGSASCVPQYKQIPVDLIREEFANKGNVKYAPGVRTRLIIPVAPPEKLKTQDGSNGVNISYFNNDTPEPVFTECREKPHVYLLGRLKPGLNSLGSRIEIKTTLTPGCSGVHTLAVRCTGAFSLSIGGREVFGAPEPNITTEQSLFRPIFLETRAQVPMIANQLYDIHLVVHARREMAIGEPTPFGATLCFEEFQSDKELINEAVKLAETSDIAVVFAGRNDQYESEGFDLDHMSMPDNQTALIKAVATVSKSTILVLHCGNPIDVSPFIDDVNAVLNAHFPGQQGASAIVDVLTGKVNPSGRLTRTWFKTLNEAPSFDYFPARNGQDGKADMKYGEGLNVGYRCDDVSSRARWHFGYGLSYSSFTYDNLNVTTQEGLSSPILKTTVRVTNTSSKVGKEVVQLYVTPNSASVWRPRRELKSFTKVTLAPGESKMIVLESDLSVSCSYWDETVASWKLEEGEYGVEVGPLHGKFRVANPKVWNHL